MTWLAGDKARSGEAALAAGIPVNHGRAEEMAVIRPDLVLADSYSDSAVVQMIRRLGIAVAVLPAASSYAGIEAKVGRVAGLLGTPERGRALVGAIEAEIAWPQARRGRSPVVAAIEPGFYTEGKGTLIDEAIGLAGGTSLGHVLGLEGYATLPLERLVSAPVDLLVLAAGSGRAPSLSVAGLSHPAIRDRFRGIPTLSIPPFLTDCPAPASAALVPMIGRAIRSLPRDAPPPERPG